MIKNKTFILFIFFNLLISATAQTVSLLEFLQAVAEFHPLAYTANYQKEIALSRFTASKTVFDPQIIGSWDNKNFAGSHYYTQKEVAVKVPIWYGFQLEAGWNDNSGSQLNNEITPGVSTRLGARWEFGKGFLLDSARYEFQDAKIGRKYAEQEQKNQLNELFALAAKAYYLWQKSYFQKKIVDSLLIQAEQRFDLIKRSVILGDRPAIDTLDALNQVQFFRIEQLNSLQELQKDQLYLSNFLWTKERKNVQLSTQAQPEEPEIPLVKAEEFYTQDLDRHPKILQNLYKTERLQLEKRFKIQRFLPSIEAYYFFLNKGFFDFSELNIDNRIIPFYESHYYGIKLKWPILFFRERGELRMNKYKLLAQSEETKQLETVLNNQVKIYHRQFFLLIEQYEQQKLSLQMTFDLYQAEKRRLDFGESSLFLLNLRESKWLETQIKQRELWYKIQETWTNLQYSAALLSN